MWGDLKTLDLRPTGGGGGEGLLEGALGCWPWAWGGSLDSFKTSQGKDGGHWGGASWWWSKQRSLSTAFPSDSSQRSRLLESTSNVHSYHESFLGPGKSDPTLLQRVGWILPSFLRPETLCVPDNNEADPSAPAGVVPPIPAPTLCPARSDHTTIWVYDSSDCIQKG